MVYLKIHLLSRRIVCVIDEALCAASHHTRLNIYMAMLFVLYIMRRADEGRLLAYARRAAHQFLFRSRCAIHHTEKEKGKRNNMCAFAFYLI